VVLRTLFIRDLRESWVFPRLAYAATGHAIDRGLRRLFRFLITRPANRFGAFVRACGDHESLVELGLAAFALVIALVRALALLLLVIGSVYLSLFRL